MRNNFIIGGVKGVGKTTVGRALAERMGRRFIDTDAEIEKRCGLPCRTLYLSRGASFFRQIEEEVILEMDQVEDAVISIGGGTILSSSNRCLLPEMGRLICLFLEKTKIRERWVDTPAFSSGDDFDRLFCERIEGYRALSCIWINADEPDLVEILVRLAHGKQ